MSSRHGPASPVGAAVGKAAGRTDCFPSERTQEDEDRLPVRRRQQIKIADNVVGFRASARMCLDRREQAAGAAVMKEEQTLSDPPERCRAELLAVGRALADLVLQADTHAVKGEVAEWRDRHLIGAGENGLPRGLLRDVTLAATDIDELVVALGRGIGRRRRGGCSREPHKDGEIDQVGGEVRCRTVGWLGIGEMCRVLGRRIEAATLSIISLVGECLVGDPLLDIVGLAREDQQGLVLGLPAEPRDRAVIAPGSATPAWPNAAGAASSVMTIVPIAVRLLKLRFVISKPPIFFDWTHSSVQTTSTGAPAKSPGRCRPLRRQTSRLRRSSDVAIVCKYYLT